MCIFSANGIIFSGSGIHFFVVFFVKNFKIVSTCTVFQLLIVVRFVILLLYCKDLYSKKSRD